MKLTAVAIRIDDWNAQAFTVLTQQVKDSARKIEKKIDVQLERKRFSNSYNGIETLALKYGKKIDIDEKKIHELLNSMNAKSAIRLPFIEYENMKAYTKFFDTTSKKYLSETKATVVFILSEFSRGKIALESGSGENRVNNIYSNIDVLNNIDSINMNEIQKRFHNQIFTALNKGTPIGWINIQEGEDNLSTLLRHEGIITCLREHIFVSKLPTVEETTYVYEEVPENKDSISICIPFFFPPKKNKIRVPRKTTKVTGIIPRFIQFAFRDGSISDPFPLYCMADTPPSGKVPNIKAALISNRHFELDNMVDVSIIRNSEISRREDATIADQERMCFEIAVKFFKDLLTNVSRIHIELFHTGLEPAVIGTYRALLFCLMEHKDRGKIILTPKLRKGNTYISLKDWY